MTIHNSPIYISGWGSVSPLGSSIDEVRVAYESGRPLISNREIGGKVTQIATLSDSGELAAHDLIDRFPKLRDVDRSVLLAVEAARQALNNSSWAGVDAQEVGINIGSSRGATSTLERFHQAFLASGMVKTPTLTSPLTTLGNVSTWIAHCLGLSGPEFSHSITCNSAMHAIANACAWLRSGMADRFLVGGSEAALTPFTFAQMRALRIYAPLQEGQRYPCRPFAEHPTTNTMILGEGAAVFALQRDTPKGVPIFKIESIGYGIDDIPSGTGVSETGEGFRVAMERAIAAMSSTSPIDLVIAHAPGTIKGDQAELSALHEVFGSKLPSITSNKWLIGHTFGASGALSLEMALLILGGMAIRKLPYDACLEVKPVGRVRKIMINAAGFGGNCSSLVVSC